MNYDAAIFDMDGTILDTTEDLTAALNAAMRQCGHKHDFTPAQICRFFGSGVTVAIQRALALEGGAALDQLFEIGSVPGRTPDGIDADEVGRMEQIYRPYYELHCAENTAPYPGILELLRDLHARGIKTAVVSNKPDAAVRELTQTYFPGLFELALGERAGIRRKPSPDMTNLALKELNVNHTRAVYIGDTEIDLQTAEASGLDCISVAWGFRDSARLKQLNAPCLVHTAQDILRYIS